MPRINHRYRVIVIKPFAPNTYHYYNTRKGASGRVQDALDAGFTVEVDRSLPEFWHTPYNVWECMGKIGRDYRSPDAARCIGNFLECPELRDRFES